MADDMGYGGPSCYDNQNFKTPEIDRLAAEGQLLSDYHSNGSICSPTRAALMTGRYQYRMGCHRVINADPAHPDHVRGLPAAEWTIAEALQGCGYTTAIFGKWHLGYKPEFNPTRHGFDTFVGLTSGNIDAHSHYDRMITPDWWQGVEREDEPGYHTDLITEHTVDFIRKHKDQPFFIYVSHAAPHSPHQARGSAILRGPDAGTVPAWGEQGMTYTDNPGDENWLIRHFILPLDEGVGRIRETVEKLGLAENTILWFISDNGGTPNNATISPLTRGDKGDNYEGGHRVPGIVWAPGLIKPGSTSAELIVGMDIMPTTLAMLGVTPPKGHHFDGVDVSSAIFNGSTLPDRAVIWGRDNQGALRQWPWEIVGDELYNLENDPQETTDLAGQYPERVSEMARLRRAMFDSAVSESPYEAVVQARTKRE